MDTLKEIEGDKLAAFRQQVKEDENRTKMSETAKAKLRALNDHDLLNAKANGPLVKEFTSRPWTGEQMVDLFSNSFGLWKPRRRAIKAMHRLSQGMRVYHLHDISLFGELLPEEVNMTMVKFLAKYSLPEDETVTPKGELVIEPPVRRCTLGRKCLRAKNNQAAQVAGNAKYCSVICRGRAKVIAKLMPLGARLSTPPLATA